MFGAHQKFFDVRVKLEEGDKWRLTLYRCNELWNPIKEPQSWLNIGEDWELKLTGGTSIKVVEIGVTEPYSSEKEYEDGTKITVSAGSFKFISLQICSELQTEPSEPRRMCSGDSIHLTIHKKE